MHANSGLADAVNSEAIQSATLDAFLQKWNDAVVVDDSVPFNDFVNEYLKTRSSSEAACFHDCTNILNQYKTWNKALPNVQPFYGTRTAFV